MLWLDVIRLFEISDGTADFEDAVIGAGRKAQFIDSLLDQLAALAVEQAKLFDFTTA